MKNMMMVLGAFLASTGVASAEPVRGYLGGGAELGTTLELTTGLLVDGGYRIGDSSHFIHAQFMRGNYDDLSEAVGGVSSGDPAMTFKRGSGTFMQGHLGIEHHSCTASGVLCGIFGADVGLLASSPSQGPWMGTPSVSYTQEQLVPRAVLDVGGRALRARLGLEMTFGTTQRHGGGPDASASGMQGTALTAGLAYQF
jgi:hypothetical protein